VNYLLSNWKMYPTTVEAVALFSEIQRGLRQRADAGRRLPETIIFPPFLALPVIRTFLDDDLVRLGGQNCHWEACGPYTGEISPAMLREVADFVMLGHSERRMAGETDEQIASKVQAAAAAGLTPVVCVGEDQRTDSAASQSERRLVAALDRFDPASHRILVVYEPTWAVGGDRPADVGYVCEVVEHLKVRMAEIGVEKPQVVYGGTVTAENVGQFTALDILDGVGATRACLNAEDFLALVDRLTEAP
jgi:triosephosphate isomerase